MQFELDLKLDLVCKSYSETVDFHQSWMELNFQTVCLMSKYLHRFNLFAAIAIASLASTVATEFSAYYITHELHI